MPRGHNAMVRNSDPASARQIVTLADLSYRELARRACLSHTTVRRVLTDKQPVTEPVAQAIAEALGLPVSGVWPLREPRDVA
jgi:lambda repressor-like predicted transcriptional regulator